MNSWVEQEMVLFFKLYFLAHTQNYINYMEQAKKLAKWFDFSGWKNIDPYQENAIYCGSCFLKLATGVRRGAFAICCADCRVSSNMHYEASRLMDITGIKHWDTVIYLMIKAVEDIYRCNNSDAIYQIIRR